MNDEQFEVVLDFIRRNWNSGGSPVSDLRARDTAQREALARVEAEHADDVKRYRQLLNEAGRDRYSAQKKLAEAVGLLQKIEQRMYGEDVEHRFTDLLADLDRITTQAEQQEGEYYCKVCRNHGCVSGCHPDYYKQQEAQGAQAGDERVAFEAAMVAEGYQKPERGSYPDSQYLYQRDQDRFVGWMARAALATQPAVGEPVAWRELADDGTPLTDWIDGAPRPGTEPVLGGETIQVAWSAPVAAGEPVHQWADEDGWWFDCSLGEMKAASDIGSRTRTVYTAPPAAAHGDEAVRKDAELPPLPESTGDITYRRPAGFIGRVEGFTRIQMRDYARAAIDAAHGDETPGTVRVTADWLKTVHRDLDACQKVIWLAGCRPRVPGGFDPAYCEDAQARLKEIDEHIARAQAAGGAQHA